MYILHLIEVYSTNAKKIKDKKFERLLSKTLQKIYFNFRECYFKHSTATCSPEITSCNIIQIFASSRKRTQRCWTYNPIFKPHGSMVPKTFYKKIHQIPPVLHKRFFNAYIQFSPLILLGTLCLMYLNRVEPEKLKRP